MKKLLIGLLALGCVSSAFAQEINTCSKSELKKFTDIYSGNEAAKKEFKTLDDFLRTVCYSPDMSKYDNMSEDLNSSGNMFDDSSYQMPDLSFSSSSKVNKGSTVTTVLPVSNRGMSLYIHASSNLNGLCMQLGYGEYISSTFANVNEFPDLNKNIVRRTAVTYRIDDLINASTGEYGEKLVAINHNTKIIKNVTCKNEKADHFSPVQSTSSRKVRKTCYAYLKHDLSVVGMDAYKLYVEKSDGTVMLISTKRPGSIQGETSSPEGLEAILPGLERELRRNNTCDNLVFEGVQQ